MLKIIILIDFKMYKTFLCGGRGVAGHEKLFLERKFIVFEWDFGNIKKKHTSCLFLCKWMENINKTFYSLIISRRRRWQKLLYYEASFFVWIKMSSMRWSAVDFDHHQNLLTLSQLSLKWCSTFKLFRDPKQFVFCRRVSLENCLVDIHSSHFNLHHRHRCCRLFSFFCCIVKIN